MASAFSDLELIRYLVEDLNCSPSIDEESPLVIAERNGNDDVVMYFIETFPWILDLSQVRSVIMCKNFQSAVLLFQVKVQISHFQDNRIFIMLVRASVIFCTKYQSQKMKQL